MSCSLAPDRPTCIGNCRSARRASAEFTLTHNGETRVFCAPVCRKVFAEEHALT